MSINNFLSEVYSEESYNFTEEDYAEVMSASTADETFDGYDEWSAAIEAMPEGDLENFEAIKGGIRYKGESLKNRPSVNGIEI